MIKEMKKSMLMAFGFALVNGLIISVVVFLLIMTIAHKKMVKIQRDMEGRDGNDD